jgi:hypothetical protein
MTVNVRERSPDRTVDETQPARAAAFCLSVGVAVTMATSAAWGLVAPGVYHEIPWAKAALRGGDLVTLLVATPLLVASLALAARGSTRAVLVWAGVLGYNVYNYAYFSFGTDFNNLFLAHIALLALSAWSAVFLLASLDVRELRTTCSNRTPFRSVATLLGATALVLTSLWTYFIVRQMVTGWLPGGAAPRAALHMVYATDLVFFVSALYVAAVLLWLRTPWGYVAGTVVTLVGAIYLLNLLSAQAFQANADVPGAVAFSAGPVLLTLVFWVAAIVMLNSLRPRPGAHR